MNDDQQDSTPPEAPAPHPNGGRVAPAVATAGTGVRSGLAERRNPALTALKSFAAGLQRVLLKNPLNTFLFFAAIALAVTFFVLLRSIGPSSYGAQIPISTVETLTQHKEISKAVLLDHDNRLEITTVAREGELPRLEWASYPSSGAQTSALISTLSKSGATVIVDEQAGKSLRTIVVQFLIPILLLVTPVRAA